MSNQSVEHYKEIIKRLNKIGVMITKEKDSDKLLKLILDETLILTSSDAGSIYFREEVDHQDLLVFKCSINRSIDFEYTGKTVFVNEDSVSGHVTLTGQTVILNKGESLDAITINKTFDQKADYLTENMVVVPMKNEMGRAVGVFQILNKHLVKPISSIINSRNFVLYE